MKTLKIKIKNEQGHVSEYEVEVEEVVSSDETKTVKKAVPETSSSSEGGNEVGRVKINAPMPGTINKVNVSVGSKVKSGDVLCVLEAMKMENDIKAGNDGTVVSVNVQKGSNVNTGDLLISIN